jgi:hypothetical protein
MLMLLLSLISFHFTLGGCLIYVFLETMKSVIVNAQA